MVKIGKTTKKMTRGRVILGVMGILLVILLVVAACGSDPTAEPDIDATIEAGIASTVDRNAGTHRQRTQKPMPMPWNPGKAPV